MKLLTHLKDKLSGKLPHGAKRSSRWASVRAAFLEVMPECAVCGGTEKLEVHHMHPFHLEPELELEPSNLITLCESKKHGVNCHLLVGHLGRFSNMNPDVQIDAATWKTKLRGHL